MKLTDQLIFESISISQVKSDLLESKATHLLFIDSDIYFQGKSIFAMLKNVYCF